MSTLIEELYLLWKPIHPYLIRQIKELYHREDGAILDIGPFSGLIFSFAQNQIGQSFSIAAFPKAIISFFHQEAKEHRMEDRIRIIESDPSLKGITQDSIDLAIFRGALFFPNLFQIDFNAIYRCLKNNGMAFVGGGFGKYTPSELIGKIGSRSEEINTALGKVRVTLEGLKDQLMASHLEKCCEITPEGGLWVVMRK